jgi:hypothetical protein
MNARYGYLTSPFLDTLMHNYSTIYHTQWLQSYHESYHTIVYIPLCVFSSEHLSHQHIHKCENTILLRKKISCEIWPEKPVLGRKNRPRTASRPVLIGARQKLALRRRKVRVGCNENLRFRSIQQTSVVCDDFFGNHGNVLVTTISRLASKEYHCNGLCCIYLSIFT